MDKLFFSGWENLFNTGITTILAYLMLIVLLRASGKRTLSKMNAFDFVVTVALGSTLATVILNRSVPLIEGILAMGLLISLQYLITWLSVRYNMVNQLVKSTPSLLVFHGKLLHQAMRRERITTDEIHAFLRKKGLNSPEEAGAVVLETDGTLTLLQQPVSLNAPVLTKLKQPEQAASINNQHT